MRLILLFFVLTMLGCTRTPAAAAADRPLILVHYMPWFSAKSATQPWGWHWTMGSRDPDQIVDRRREIAAHQYPAIGPYDSCDPDVLEYHTLLMKVAGIDGVIADWYGTDDVHDYPFIHRATHALFEHTKRSGLKFAVCYEDRSIVAGENKGDRVERARRVVDGLAATWMADASYVTIRKRPALLVFGPQGLSGDEWKRVLDAPVGAPQPRPLLLTLHRAAGPAEGVFDWPLPQNGGIAAAEKFPAGVAKGLVSIPVVFPRFQDYYAQARVRDSYGLIADDDGKTFSSLLARGFTSGAPFLQIATWNDWGEGTQIEPSVEFGHRDLLAIQSLRRSSDAAFAFDAEDLSIPELIFRNRREAGANANLNALLDDGAALIRAAKPKDAAAKLRSLKR